LTGSVAIKSLLVCREDNILCVKKLTSDENKNMEQTVELLTSQIQLPKNNMREYIDRDEIFELAEDIKKNGLISPIIVRPVEFDHYANWLPGQRRYLAFQFSGMFKIKCIIRNLTLTTKLSLS